MTQTNQTRTLGNFALGPFPGATDHAFDALADSADKSKFELRLLASRKHGRGRWTWQMDLADGPGKMWQRTDKAVVNKSPKRVEASTSIGVWHSRQFTLLLLRIGQAIDNTRHTSCTRGSTRWNHLCYIEVMRNFIEVDEEYGLSAEQTGSCDVSTSGFGRPSRM